MKYQEIIDTIKVGDYVEVKRDPSFEDGVYEVDDVDVFDDGASVRLWNNRDRFWVYDKCIVRKISDGELSSNEIKQNSQKENDSSHIGNSDPKNWNGIVVGSEWEFIGEDRGLFTPGKSYIVKYAYPIETCLVDEQGDNHYFTINTFSDYFKPVEQTSEQLREQLTSHEPSGGVVKVGEIRDPEPQSCVKLQYDPRDVAFHRNTARWWLEKAIDIQKDRASEYDKEEERSASSVAKIFNILRDKDLTEADVFLILQILKQVRFCQNFDKPHEDSLLDNVSYASLFAEAVMRNKNTV